MIYQLKVPVVVSGVEEIRVLEWHVEMGESLAVGDLIVEMETHKAIVEIRSGQAGVLRQILAQGGDWRAVGLPVALFSTDANEVLPSDAAEVPDLAVEFEVT